MTEDPTFAKHPDLPEWLVFAIPAGLIVGLSLSLQGLNGWPAFDDRWVGPDSYMRLVRILELINGANWWEPVSMRSNFPDGEVLHWSRAFDLWVLTLSVPLLPFFETSTAVKIAAQVASICLRLGVLVSLLWAVRPFSTAGGRLAIGAVFAMQFSILTYLAVGRPDHHGLILLAWTIALGLLFRLLKSPWRMQETIITGVILGIALWISIEGLFAASMIFLSLSLTWLFFDEGRARQLFVLSVVLSLTIMATIALEFTPSNWLGEVYDKISFPHLVVSFFIMLLWALIQFLPQRSLVARIAAASVATSAVLLFVFLVYPKLIAGPMVDVDPRVIRDWYAHNAEVAGMIGADGFKFSDPKVIVYGLQALVIFPFLIFRACRVQDTTRRIWMLLAVLSLTVAGLAVMELRWSVYFELIAAIGIGLVLAILFAKMESWNIAARALCRIPLVLGLMIGPQLVGLTFATSQSNNTKVAGCDIKQLASYLNTNYADRAHTILASNFAGPELLYRTKHNVIGTPYHRNGPGILDSIDVLEWRDGETSQAIIERRKIDLILICPLSEMSGKVVLHTKYPRPNRLREIELPAENRYLLFEVMR